MKVTLRVLGQSRNEAALPWLVAALTAEHAALRTGGIETILERRSPVGYRAIVQYWHRLTEPERRILAGHGVALSAALSDGLLSTESQLNVNACSMVVWLRGYDQIPKLVRAAQISTNPRAELAARATVALAEHLNAELHSPRDYRNRRDPALVLQSVYGCLAESVQRFAYHRLNLLVEAFLLLAPKDDSFLGHLILDPNEPAYHSVMDQFVSSSRPGIMRLVLEMLSESHPPAAMFQVIGQRQDKPFLQLLLAHRSDRWSPEFRQNLKEVESWPWFNTGLELLGKFSDEEVGTALQLIAASGVERARVFDIVQCALVQGGVWSRRAAIRLLDEFHGMAGHTLVWNALEDSDPEVQALAIRWLRGRNIPGAKTRLIEMLDSPHELVRSAVQHELTEFTFQRFLDSFLQLDDEARRRTGVLVRRVDPDAIGLLRIELTSPSRARRLRGLAIAVAMHASRDVAEEILILSGDADHFVRAATVPALLNMNTESARRRLEELQLDPATATREAVSEALLRLFATPDPFVSLPSTAIGSVTHG